MTGVGLDALPEGGRIDFTGLRQDRRARLFEEMEAAELDVLVLGRPANIAYASGARQLWTAGSRPFAPGCVVFGNDQRIHLLATWDEGVPSDIPRDDLWGLSWNPSVAAGHLRAVPGLVEARRIGTDGTSVGFRRLMTDLAPSAQLLDAGPALHAARSRKSPGELAAIETSCAVAEAGLEAMRNALEAGVSERELLARHVRRVGELGAPVTPDEVVANATRDGFGRTVGDRRLEAGELVALTPSASYAGYEASLGRTFAVGASPSGPQVDLGRRCRAALDAVLEACRPGATGRDLLDVWARTGGEDLPAPLVHGAGLGPEPPLVGLGAGVDAELTDGMVLVVQGWMPDVSFGGWFERDVIAVAPDGSRRLTRWDGP